MKLDERILRHFKIGVFIGVRKSNRGMHTAFFMNGKEVGVSDLGMLMSGLKELPVQVRCAYEEMTSAAKDKKRRRRRKKNAQ